MAGGSEYRTKHHLSAQRHLRTLAHTTAASPDPDNPRMPVFTSRALLIVDLRTYGEDDIADALVDADRERLQQIFDRADHYLYADEFSKPSGASPLIAKALSRAAVEIFEGAPRPLRWKRRKLKGIYPGC